MTDRAARPPLRDVVTADDRRQLYRDRGWWDDTTVLGEFRRHAGSRPGEVAVVSESGTLTYGELDEASSRLAAHLLGAGIGCGDVVSMQLPNWAEAAIVTLGVAKAGATIHTLLPGYREKELGYMMDVAGSKALVTPHTYHGYDFTALAAALRSRLPRFGEHLVVGEGAEGATSLADALAAADPDPDIDALGAGDVGLLIFTSGTEAEPKAIMHTDQSVAFSARAAYEALAMQPSDVVWMPSPIGHSTGFNYGLRFALYHGLKLVLQDRWDPAVAAQLIEREGCSYTLAATTFLSDLLHSSEAGAHDLSTMRLFGCGGAPVPAELVELGGRRGVEVLRLYGSTEALVVTWNRPDAPLDKRLSTDGNSIHQGVELQVVDGGGGTPVAPGTPGELRVRGPNTCAGFFADPERTAQTFIAGGWVKSGDVGTLDPDGYFTVVGRKKEIIIRGGMNIAPREVEDVLLRLPAIEEAAVLGVPDPRLGEVTCACITTAGGADLTLADVIEHLNAEGLAKYKFPERFAVVESLPMTASGKVRKHVLRERLLAGEVRVEERTAIRHATGNGGKDEPHRR